MDPVSLFFLLGGFKATEELMVKLGLTQNTIVQPMKYQDYKPNQRGLQIIKQNESKYGEKAPNPKAYIDNAWTIGFGTCFLYDDNGKPVNINGSNAIKSNYTLAYLKGIYKSVETDYQFAERLIINHWRQSRYQVAARALDTLNVPFYSPLAESLADAAYNHGSIFKGKSWDGQFDLFCVALSKTDDKKIWAALYLQYRCFYAATAMNNSDWQKFKLGLIRRYYQCALNLINPLVSISDVRKKTPTLSVLYNEIFKNLGLRLTV